MLALTLTLAAITSALATLATPSRALSVYCAALFLYPQALTIPIGPADFSLGRICILAVLANAVRHGRHRSFEWTWIDVGLLASWALGLVALLQTFPAVALERHSGAFFDSILPYLAVRLCLTSRRELVSLIRDLALIAVPLVPLAVYQTITGQNPFGAFAEHYRFGLTGNRSEVLVPRLGLRRASVSFTHPIAFGLFCAMVATLTSALWNQRQWSRPMVGGLIGIACVGLFTTLSSGPLLALATAAFVLIAYTDWRAAAALALVAVAVVVSLAVYSGNPYLEVASWFAYSPKNAHFRLGLVREALGGGMTGHWWTGYGYVGIGPGTDNTHFHWEHRDFVNLYVQILVRTGLLGLIPFLFANVLIYARLAKAVRAAATPQSTWLAWCVLAAVVGLNAGMMTVGVLSQTLQLLYITFAMASNLPIIVASGLSREQAH